MRVENNNFSTYLIVFLCKTNFINVTSKPHKENIKIKKIHGMTPLMLFNGSEQTD